MANDNTAGNFILGQWFGEVRCLHGHKTRLFNIGRDHFVACDNCRSFLHVGSNLMSDWRDEDSSLWQRNRESIEGYEYIEMEKKTHGGPLL
ncbi:hypothetical protein ACFL6U_25395 [Planctomycetota bacterium]